MTRWSGARRFLLLAALVLAWQVVPLAWAQVYDPTTGYQIVIPSGGGGGTPSNVNVNQWSGSTPVAVGTGIVGVAQTPTATAAAGITPVVSTSLEATHVLDGSPGNLYSVVGTNLTGGVSGNMQVFNATSAPVDGAVTPLVCVPFDSLGKAQAFFAPGPPMVFSTGITVVASSAVSCFTKTTGVITAMFVGMSK